jgi:hypothetical protein
MRDARDITAIRETLRFVIDSQIPAQHKAIVIDALAQALRAADDVKRSLEIQEMASEEWRPEEALMIEAALRGKVANSWQHADEVLMRLARGLHRRHDDVRRKATELGHGAAVDYALAKARRTAAIGDE